MINYDEERPKGKDAEICNSANPIQKICKDLLSCTFYDLDWKVAQDRCLVYLNHECSDVRGLAATCLGHVARIHRQIDREKVLEALGLHLRDDDISGQVQSVIEDVEKFG